MEVLVKSPDTDIADAALVEALIDGSPEAIIVVDGSKAVLRTNPAFASLCGRPVGDLEGLPFRKALPQDDAGCQLSDAIDRAFETRVAGSTHILCNHGHGFELELEVRLQPIVEAGRIKFVVSRLRQSSRDADLDD